MHVAYTARDKHAFYPVQKLRHVELGAYGRHNDRQDTNDSHKRVNRNDVSCVPGLIFDTLHVCGNCYQRHGDWMGNSRRTRW
jgi:hypothetical protein